MIEISTSGALGVSDLLRDLYLELRPVVFYDGLDTLVEAAARIHWPQFGEVRPLLIDMRVEFDREDLRAGGDSPAFLRYRDLLVHLLPLFEVAGQEVHFVTREHGFGFIPMGNAPREQIRRESDLTAAVVRRAARYRIALAGPTYLTVFDRRSGRTPPDRCG